VGGVPTPRTERINRQGAKPGRPGVRAAAVVADHGDDLTGRDVEIDGGERGDGAD
jgi:hypothetical protein